MITSGASLGLGSGQSLTSGLVSDPAAYSGLSRVAREGGTEGLEAAARAFESLLVGQMLKQMRSMTQGSGLFDSAHSQLYQDLYDQQIAAVLSEGEGLGLRKALLRQLAPELSESRTRRARSGQLTRSGAQSVAQELQAASGRGGGRGRPNPGPSRLEAVKSRSEHLPPRQCSDDECPSAAARPVSGGGRWPPRNAEEFVAYLKPYAEQAAEILGMDTSVLLAQSALETGWGKHIPRRADGDSSFNLFGIKADRSWKGDSVGVGTLEYRNGVAQREQARFRAYETPADSFVDYVAFLKRNPRYGEALKSRSGEEFIRGLQKAGYATDPRYANKILGIRDRVLAIGAAIESQTAPHTKSETQVSAAQADTPAKG
jgi:peptidoglycan hydrolase FlgJ